MADFSKQYCENFDSEFPKDFDIFEIAEQLDPGNYTPIICEGFGFIAIGKDESGKVILAVPRSLGDEEVDWKSLEELIELRKKQLN